jgi:hypothetical protein
MANCRTLYASPEQSTLVCGPLGVVIWRGAATLAGINRVREMGLAALQSSPGGAVLFGVIEESAAMPDAEQRRRSAAVNDELAALGVIGFGAVLGSQGFSGAIVRSVVTGLSQIARNRYAFRAFPTVNHACEWGAKLLGAASVDWRAHAAEIERIRYEHVVRFSEPLSGLHRRGTHAAREELRVTHLGR